jgi:hypothetical protein
MSKANNQKADLSKSRYFADIFPQSKKPICKKPICKKPICQKADNQKADPSKSRSVKKPIFCPSSPFFKGELRGKKADMQ